LPRFSPCAASGLRVQKTSLSQQPASSALR